MQSIVIQFISQSFLKRYPFGAKNKFLAYLNRYDKLMFGLSEFAETFYCVKCLENKPICLTRCEVSFMLSVVRLNVFMLSVFMLSVFMLSVVKLNVFMLSVVAPK
jgi:hypothetical protein